MGALSTPWMGTDQGRLSRERGELEVYVLGWLKLCPLETAADFRICAHDRLSLRAVKEVAATEVIRGSLPAVHLGHTEI